MSRRSMIAAGSVAALAAGAGATLGYGALAAPEQVVARFLRRTLPGIAVADAELEAFARDYLPRASWSGAKLDGALLVMDNPALIPLLPDGVAAAFDWFSRRLFTYFLLSTDFLSAAGRDPAKTRYVQFADPYAMGCRNPLANLEPDSATERA